LASELGVLGVAVAVAVVAMEVLDTAVASGNSPEDVREGGSLGDDVKRAGDRIVLGNHSALV
jgi:hypothetical protein